jgi:hypothetical protein
MNSTGHQYFFKPHHDTALQDICVGILRNVCGLSANFSISFFSISASLAPMSEYNDKPCASKNSGIILRQLSNELHGFNSSYGESFQGYIKKENKTAKKSLKKYHNRGSEGDITTSGFVEDFTGYSFSRTASTSNYESVID